MDLSRMARFTAAFATAALLAGCGGDGGTDPNVPPTASILSPDDGAMFTAGETISFEATATDPEDGPLTGSSVVWSSNLDGRLGTGTSLTATLTAGSHTVTVTATDSDDERGTDSVSVEVAQLASVCSPGDPGVAVDLAVGTHATFNGESAYCLQFGETSSTAEYLMGVQSTASTVSSLTPIRITGDPGAAAAVVAGGVLQTASPLVAAEAPTAADPRSVLSERAQRLRRHRVVESRLREWELANLPLLQPAVSEGGLLSSSAVAAATVLPAVDDTLDLRVVDLTRQADFCTGFAEVRGVVRLVGENSIWLEDVDNPEPGFSLSDLQALSDLFDQTIHQVDSTWFGAPTDIDENGRMIVLITKEVNRADEEIPNSSQISSTLGFVFGGDLYSRSDCAASNEAEIYYSRAPDPEAEAGLKAYSVEAAKADAPFILAHEFVHTIQFGRRIERSLGGLPRWVSEGQATLAEELVGWDLDGLGPGQDLGIDVAFDTTGIDWYSNAFVDMALYFGLKPADGGGFTKEEEAPHECSWLDVQAYGNDGACYPVREVYGVPWSLLRWVSDLFGPEYPGGAPALQRDLVVASGTGYQGLESVVSEPIETLLASWAPMLYTDGRAITNLDPRLTFPSWNLWGIFQRLVPEARLVPMDRPFGAFDTELQVRAGSSAYLRLTGASAATAIGVGSPSGADLPGTAQVWIVRLQ